MYIPIFTDITTAAKYFHYFLILLAICLILIVLLLAQILEVQEQMLKNIAVRDHAEREQRLKSRKINRNGGL